MSVPVKLGAFALVLLASFGLAWGVGAAVDPIGDAAPSGSMTGHAHADEAPAADTTGLAIAGDGVRLVPESTELAVGAPAPFRFRIERTDDGTAVQDYDISHERELHLVVVDQALASFQHVHPVRDATGTWSVDMAVPAPGAYRVYADFRLPGADRSTVLSTTATAPGTPPAPPALAEQRDATSPGGYGYHLDGDLVAGTASEVAITVTLDGVRVVDLDPYLGAAGHLVALRAGDLAYSHVHPVGDETSGPTIHFSVDVPFPGTYRLFLDVSHDGRVRTAAFTVEVPPVDEPVAPAHASDGHEMDGHG